MNTHTPPPSNDAAPVTPWFRLGDKGFEFNHLEDGHAEVDKPASRMPSQANPWARGTWVREHAGLEASVPPRVRHAPDEEAARRRATERPM